MTRSWIVMLLFGMMVSLVGGCANHGGDGAGAADFHEEVLASLQAQAAAWSRGDLEAFTAGYAEDAVFISPGGLTRGRDEVLARYRRSYPDPAAMGSLELEPLDVRLGCGDRASVVARWTLSYPEAEAATGLTLIVLERVEGHWLVVHDASM